MPYALPLTASTVYSLHQKVYIVAKRLSSCSPWTYSCKFIREQTLKIEPFTNLFVMETPNKLDLVLKDAKNHLERTFSKEANSLLRDEANSPVRRVPGCCWVLHPCPSHNAGESPRSAECHSLLGKSSRNGAKPRDAKIHKLISEGNYLWLSLIDIN